MRRPLPHTYTHRYTSGRPNSARCAQLCPNAQAYLFLLVSAQKCPSSECFLISRTSPFPALTSRDREILEVITQRVKLLTIPQVARTWWRDSVHAISGARRRLAALERQGMVQSFTVFAHPELPLLEPAFIWTPNEKAPNFDELSYQLCSRWTAPFQPVTAVIASRAAANYFGGHGARFPKQVEENHDVHLAAVFLSIRATRPGWAEHWISEQRIRSSRPDAPGEKLPDAMVRMGGMERVIDFGGSYSAPKLRGFHHWASDKKLSYELW